MCTQTEVIGHIITFGMSVAKRPAGQSARQRGEVAVEMTAQDILSSAVNVAQNKWPLDESHSTAKRVMLEEVLEQILEANRLAVDKRLAKRVR